MYGLTYVSQHSEPLFEPSTITNDGDKTQRNVLVRDSEVALVPRTEVVRCVEARARSMQGWRDDLWVERLRTQRYGPSQHVTPPFRRAVSTPLYLLTTITVRPSLRLGLRCSGLGAGQQFHGLGAYR